VNEWVLSRLDGKYEACQWPSENELLAPIVDGGDRGCELRGARKAARLPLA
jgi:hypothetical protein